MRLSKYSDIRNKEEHDKFLLEFEELCKKHSVNVVEQLCYNNPEICKGWEDNYDGDYPFMQYECFPPQEGAWFSSRCW